MLLAYAPARPDARAGRALPAADLREGHRPLIHARTGVHATAVMLMKIRTRPKHLSAMKSTSKMDPASPAEGFAIVDRNSTEHLCS